MSKRSFIDSVEVKAPCSESWDEMTGTDKIRFCSHCTKHVNNISEMTRKEAGRFVRASGGNICIRYIADPNTRRPLFADGLLQIARRTPGITAGVMAASLSIGSARAQEASPTPAPSPSPAAEIVQLAQPMPAKDDAVPSPSPIVGGRITGTVADQNGAVIPGTAITIVSIDGKVGFKGNTDEEGRYVASGIPIGTYTIAFEYQGFKTGIVKNLAVYDGQEPRVDVALEVASSAYVMVGGGAYVEYSTKLAQAVADDDLDKARDLLVHGENVNGKDDNYDGVTPLFIAVENGNVGMVKLLLGFGAKVNTRDRSKQTPLMRLDEDATPELVATLMQAGAKIDLVDKEGNTVLIRAAGRVDVEVLKELLRAGADVRLANKEGFTALMRAADEGSVESVRTLITAGSDVNAKNKEGETAWDLTGKDEIEELLVACGAVVPIKVEDLLPTPTPTPTPTL